MKTSPCPSVSMVVLTVFLVMACLPCPVLGQPAGNLKVTSDEMVAEQDKSVVEFIGNVKAVQEDTELLADSIKVFFHTSQTRKADKDKGKSNVKKIVAAGNVKYTTGEHRAFADKAVYTVDDQVLVLTGKAPKLLTGNSWVTGKKITLFRLDQRVMVESDGSSRVQAFFDAQDQDQLQLPEKAGKDPSQ